MINLAVTAAQVMNLPGDGKLFATLSNPQVIQDVQPVSSGASGQPITGYEYRLEVPKRVYGIRNRIVHMKEGSGRAGQHLLAPYRRKARDLGTDLRLARFVAEHTIEYWAIPLP